MGGDSMGGEAMPTISVAMCTYNGARWVAEQVRSIFAQDVAIDEFIVSDDASADDTLAIIEREVAAAGHSAVLRIIRNQTPLGVTANFEQALLATTGEFVALSDQDDRWQAGRLSRALAVFDADPAATLTFGDARIIDGDGEPTGAALFATLGVSADERARVEAGRALDALLRRNLVTGATVLLRRELIDRAVPFPIDWVHDEWLAVVAALTSRVAIVPGDVIDYRIHGGNQIGVARLTPTVAIGRLTEPRGERNRRMASQWAQLESRVPALGAQVTPADAELVRNKAAHERFRAALPASRFGRIRPVLRHARTGAYSQFSRGPQDVLRDLVQPA